MARIPQHLPLPYGVARVDDRRVGGVYVILDGLQWKDAAKVRGPHSETALPPVGSPGEPRAVRLDAFPFAKRRSISGRVEMAQ
jgi:hypothetical protein